MKTIRTTRRAATASAAVAVLIAAATAQAQKPTGELRTLLVGFKDFASFGSLPAAVEDMGAATAGIGAAAQLRKADLITMSDSDDGTPLFPIAANLRGRVTDLAQRVTPEDRLLFFLSGRVHVGAGKAYLVPADGDPLDPSTLMSLRLVGETLANSPAKTRLMFLSIWDAKAEELAEPLQKAMEGLDVTLIAAVSPAREAASGAAKTRLSTFLFLEALKGGGDAAFAGNQDGVISLHELAVGVQKATAAQVESKPETALRVVLANESAKHPFLLAEAVASVTEVGALWKKVNDLEKHPGVAELFAKAVPVHKEAQEFLTKGYFTAAVGKFDQLKGHCDALLKADRIRKTALRLKAEVAEAAKKAEQLDATEGAPMLYAAALADMQKGTPLHAANRFDEAVTAWTNAKSNFLKACYQTVKQRLDDRIDAKDREALDAYGGQEWIKVAITLTDADRHAAEGDYGAAVDPYVQALKAVEIAAPKTAAKLFETARRFDSPDKYSTALVFIDQLQRIVPGHAESLALRDRIRANYRFKPGQTITNGHKIPFVYVPAGEFVMGSPEGEVGRDADEVQHKVRISKGFFLAVTEITHGQWTAVMGKDYVPPQGVHPSDRDAKFTGDEFPKSTVTWREAILFCEKLQEQQPGIGYRLPTEAEWEYACRAGAQSPFNNGKAFITSVEANVFDPVAEQEGPRAVMSMKGTNKWGVRNMHGNLWEWCADWYAPYRTDGVQVDPQGPKKGVGDPPKRVVRGGSWFDDANMARSANRWDYLPAVSSPYIGFRIVLPAEDWN